MADQNAKNSLICMNLDAWGLFEVADHESKLTFHKLKMAGQNEKSVLITNLNSKFRNEICENPLRLSTVLSHHIRGMSQKYIEYFN